MDYIFIPLAKFFQWCFTWMESLGNLPNNIFLIGGFIGLIYWCMKQARYNREAANNPGQLK